MIFFSALLDEVLKGCTRQLNRACGKFVTAGGGPTISTSESSSSLVAEEEEEEEEEDEEEEEEDGALSSSSSSELRRLTTSAAALMLRMGDRLEEEIRRPKRTDFCYDCGYDGLLLYTT